MRTVLLAAAPSADHEEDAAEETPIKLEEVPVHLLESDGEFRDTGPIGEVIDIHQYGQSIESAVKMGAVLDQQTPHRRDPDRDGEKRRRHVPRRSGRRRPREPLAVSPRHQTRPGGPHDKRYLETEPETKTATGNETDADDEAEREDGPATPGAQEEVHAEQYPGTDVWLIELPQFADEKRDPDDYLQEGWLGLIPPSDWAQHVTLGEPPRNSDPDGESETDPVPA